MNVLYQYIIHLGFGLNGLILHHVYRQNKSHVYVAQCHKKVK